MTKDLAAGATLGADKGHDAEAFVEGLAQRGIVPHVAVNGSVGKVRKTAVPPEVAARAGYAAGMRNRKRIGEILRWTKFAGGLAQLKLRGLAKVGAAFVFGLAALNLVLLPKLLAPGAGLCPDAGK